MKRGKWGISVTRHIDRVDSLLFIVSTKRFSSFVVTRHCSANEPRTNTKSSSVMFRTGQLAEKKRRANLSRFSWIDGLLIKIHVRAGIAPTSHWASSKWVKNRTVQYRLLKSLALLKLDSHFSKHRRLYLYIYIYYCLFILLFYL